MKMSELFEFGVCFEVRGGQISNRYEEITEAQADYIEDETNNHDRLEQENAELREQLKDSHEWLGINADYWGTPLCVNNEKLLNK